MEQLIKVFAILFLKIIFFHIQILLLSIIHLMEQFHPVYSKIHSIAITHSTQTIYNCQEFETIVIAIVVVVVVVVAV